jgi:hypothetical protein
METKFLTILFLFGAAAHAEEGGGATQVVDLADGEGKTQLTAPASDARVLVDEDGLWAVESLETPDSFRGDFWLEDFAGAASEVGVDYAAVLDNRVTQSWLVVEEGIEHALLVEEGEELETEVVFRLRCVGLIPSTAEDRRNAVFFVDGRQPVVTYRNLTAFDDSDRELAAWFDAVGDVLEIHVDVTDAAWPIFVDPIISSPGTDTRQGVAASDNFGAMIAVRDINNDGRFDVAVGVPGFDETGLNNEGAAQVFLGNGPGMSSTSITRPSGIAGNAAGGAVALADVDGDGDLDLLSASPGETNGQTAEGRIRIFKWNGTTFNTTAEATALETNVTNCNMKALAAAHLDDDAAEDVVAVCGSQSVVVWLGNAAGVPAAPSQTSTSSCFGSLAIADLNGDTRDDVIVGGACTGTTSTIRVFRGEDTAVGVPLNPSYSFTPTGASGSGLTVAAGDFNGDRIPDLIVGDPFHSTSAGRYQVFFNSGGQTIDSTADQTVTGTAGSLLGIAVAAGDVNNDGAAEAVICTQGTTQGSCKVQSGKVGFGIETASNRLTISGEHTNEFLGVGAAATPRAGLIAIAPVTTGAGDLVIASPRWGAATSNSTGHVQRYDGQPAGIGPSTNSSFGDQGGAAMGSVVIFADINGDGRDDVVVGMPNYKRAGNAVGAVWAFLADANQFVDPTADWQVFGSQVGQKFGAAVTFGRFLDYGHAPQLAIGAPNDGAFDRGAVYLYTMGTGGTLPDTNVDGAPLADNTSNNGHFGLSLANSGTLIDTVGDGLAVGAPDAGNGGAVFVYRSQANSTLALQAALTGSGVILPVCDSFFGSSLANIGNVDYLNSRDDLLVGGRGCESDSALEDEGGAFIFRSLTNGMSVVPVWSTYGGQAGARYGSSVAHLGRVNNDDFEDFAVGAPLDDRTDPTTTVDAGSVSIFHGRAPNNLPLTTPAIVLRGFAADDQFGAAIAGAEDVNRDGFDDLIVGAPYHDAPVLSGGSNAGDGMYLVYHGGLAGFDTTSAHSLEGTIKGGHLGASVAMTDVAPDEYGDIIVGEPGWSDTTFNQRGRTRFRFGRW